METPKTRQNLFVVKPTLGPPPGSFSEYLRAKRVEASWTQKKLAEGVGVSLSTVKRWERL